MEKLIEWTKQNKKTIAIFLLIFFIGVFLRTYNFHDWLRFSKDQSRDAAVVGSAIKGDDHLPYLGPNAGTTKFRLGPAYYYFSYASEKMFGNYPDKMAYPSVFFSILSIPLFYFFVREFFNRNLSLALMLLMSVSYFMVINSRFSSNPNLITFFLLLYLYSILQIINNRQKNIILWSALAGIGMGIGVQLHTSLLIAMPIVTVVVYGYLFLKDKTFAIKKSLASMAILFLLVNTAQIYSEFDSGGKNFKYFLKGFEKSANEGPGKNGMIENTILISACQIQANTHILASIQEDDPCWEIIKGPHGKTIDSVKRFSGLLFSIIFSFFGYFLLWKRFRGEKEERKKNFLGLVILFNLVSFVIFIPIAGMIYVGYFINLFMIPLVLLGLIIEKIYDGSIRYAKFITIAIFILLIAASLARDGQAARRYFQGLENNVKNSTLGEIEKMRDYILTSSGDSEKIYFAGDGEALTGRFFAPLGYFAKESGKKMEKVALKSEDMNELEAGTPIYFIELNGPEKIKPGEMRKGLEIISGRKFSSQTILQLKNPNENN